MSGRPPPPGKCFMAPGWGVRAVCSLCNFSTFFGPRDLLNMCFKIQTIKMWRSSLLTFFSHLFLEKCVCFFLFFSEWLARCFSPNGCYFRQSLESFWRACARWASQSWMAIQADLDASPWSMRVNNKINKLDSFKVFLLFCTMDSLPSRLLQEGMIFLVHLEPKHLTSKSPQVILRCFFVRWYFQLRPDMFPQKN